MLATTIDSQLASQFRGRISLPGQVDIALGRSEMGRLGKCGLRVWFRECGTKCMTRLYQSGMFRRPLPQTP